MAQRFRNHKTLISFDVSTRCPRTRAGRPCPYCYVDAPRRHGGARAKRVRDRIPYDNWVLNLKQATVDRLNAMGGVRMFAFGDYEAKRRRDVSRFLGDCLLRGLGAKAITKAPPFLERHHDAPALWTAHLSVDSLGAAGGGIAYAEARRLRARYAKTLVRAVCLSPEDLEFFGSRPWVDILTLNHGANGFHRFTPAEKLAAAARYGDRLCCAGGVCAACDVRCGVVPPAAAAG
jgi:hypothetical protein